MRSIIENEGRHGTLWEDRINALRATGKNSFTYSEISSVWGTAKPNTFNKVKDWSAKFPDLVAIIDIDGEHSVFFRFDETFAWPPFGKRVETSNLIVPEYQSDSDDPAVPRFFDNRTFKNVYDRVLTELRSYTLDFERLTWDAHNQRGKVVVKAVDGMGHVVMKATFHIDNGYVVNRPRWGT